MIMVKNDNETLMGEDDEMLDDEPIPAKRDTSIFKHGKEEKNEKSSKDKKPVKEEKEEEFDEDVFV